MGGGGGVTPLTLPRSTHPCLLGAIFFEKWITNPLIQVMREIDTLTNELW